MDVESITRNVVVVTAVNPNTDTTIAKIVNWHWKVTTRSLNRPRNLYSSIHSFLSTGGRRDLCYRANLCFNGGSCLQISAPPGFRCRCEGTGYYGPRCENGKLNILRCSTFKSHNIES